MKSVHALSLILVHLRAIENRTLNLELQQIQSGLGQNFIILYSILFFEVAIVEVAIILENNWAL